MKLDMFDINRFIELNHVERVTNPIFFASNKLPTEDGLLSYKIFGYSEMERKNKFGYIDLNGYFIHPIVYAMLSSRMGSLRSVISGEKYAKIIDGKIFIVSEPSDGEGTGLEFIYNNFEKINWLNELEENEIASIDKKTRLKFLKSLKKNEFFVNKWLVLPAHYREERDASSVGDVINSLYKDLLAATRSLRSGLSFDLFANTTKMRIQNLLLQIYQTTMNPVSGKSLDTKTGELAGQSKNSLLSRHLLAKNLDYGANTVIVAPVISDCASMDKLPVPFGTALLPLETCIALFNPFFIHQINIILEHCSEVVYQQVKNQTSGEFILDRTQFNSKELDKLTARFIKSKKERFDPVKFVLRSTKDKNIVAETTFMIKEYPSEADAKADRNFVKRPLTYCDLFYQAAVECLKNKHALITRHPVTNFKNIYPALVIPNSTCRTHDVYMYGLNPDVFKSNIVHYEKYPYIQFEGDPNPKPKPYYDFVGTSIIGNPVLKALGGDYDGDMIFLRGLFSIQANDEAAKLIEAKSNLLNPDGSPSRRLSFIGKDAVVTLYELTKD